MDARKNIITTDSEFINATSRLDNIQRKFEDVSPIWKSGKLRSEMTDKEIKILSEYENMMDCEAIGIKVGDKVAYRLDGDNKIYSGTVIDILDRGDIRTDTDGILCAGQYAKINTTPTETPQIPTESTETANGAVEGERAGNKPYYTHRWRVLHNCGLKTWDKFNKKHKGAILVFHHGTTYSVLQNEAVRVSKLCGIAYKVNRHGVEVCQFDDTALNQIIEQGLYVAIIELSEEPDCGLSEPPQSPETPQTGECTTGLSKLAQTA